MAFLQIRTEEEIDKLKNSWQFDPIWDIEETEGFEAHKEELLLFRKEVQAIWDERRNKRLLEKAEKMGIPGNVALAEYIDRIESQIEQLEQRVSILIQCRGII